MFKYDPPARIDDLEDRPTRQGFLDAWHTMIDDSFRKEIADLPATNQLFFSESSSPATSGDLPVTWNAFPLAIKREQPDDTTARWAAADRLAVVDRTPDGAPQVSMPCRVQDEYCEWFAYRTTPNGPISRIVFTAEAPEYWIELARHDFAKVVELYQTHVSPAVQADDLKLEQDILFGDEVLPRGFYNPYNKWNTSQGVMHLTHPANTLGAEINLAARATIPRKDAGGARVTEQRRFACGSDFGDPNRSSDPSIGSGVSLTSFPAAAGSVAQSITLANPVGLYIDNVANVITDDDDNPLPGWFKIVRGVPGRGLMAVLEPPPGAALGLEKVRILGDMLTHGGQVAEHIQMILYAKTANLGHPTPPLQSCVGHCCRPSNPADVDVETINLTHLGATRKCAAATSKDAFPELLGAPVPVPAMALDAAVNAADAAPAAPLPKLALTRLAGSRYGG